MTDSAPSNIVQGVSPPEPKTWLEKNTGSIIALIMIAGGMAIIAFAPDNKATAVIPLITFILGYFFGTGVGSQAKDKIISSLKGAGQ